MLFQARCISTCIKNKSVEPNCPTDMFLYLHASWKAVVITSLNHPPHKVKFSEAPLPVQLRKVYFSGVPSGYLGASH